MSSAKLQSKLSKSNKKIVQQIKCNIKLNDDNTNNIKISGNPKTLNVIRERLEYLGFKEVKTDTIFWELNNCKRSLIDEVSLLVVEQQSSSAKEFAKRRPKKVQKAINAELIQNALNGDYDNNENDKNDNENNGNDKNDKNDGNDKNDDENDDNDNSNDENDNSDDNDNICQMQNKNGNQCKYTKKYGNLCTRHYKAIMNSKI